MKRILIAPLLLVLALALFLVTNSNSSLAEAESKASVQKEVKPCQFNSDFISEEMVLQSQRIQDKYTPRRADSKKKKPRNISRQTAKQMLTRSWQAFGFEKEKAQKNAEYNLRQIKLESGFRTYIKQGHIGDVSDPNPAGGLFQFIPETFEEWKLQGYGNRFNPLSNILAAVNAQVNSSNKVFVLKGKSGWGPGSNPNPCQG